MPDPHHRALARWIAREGFARAFAINGAQGSGKTRLALRLKEMLAQRNGLRVVVLSLDDFYLPRYEREALAQRVHPLLRTRGVPGTHDLLLAQQVLDRLLLRSAEDAPWPVRVPRFIKAVDERAPESRWMRVARPPDLVLFEGWCMNLPPQRPEDLEAPVNELEAREDADGIWRRHVNGQLAEYGRLFRHIPRTIFLEAPDFDCVHGWRLQQELDNAREAGDAADGSSALMDAAALRRFIQHYERLTRHALRVLPQRADAVIRLDRARNWLELSLADPRTASYTARRPEWIGKRGE